MCNYKVTAQLFALNGAHFFLQLYRLREISVHGHWHRGPRPPQNILSAGRHGIQRKLKTC